MAGLQNIFKPSAGTRPRLACEVRAEGVIAARAATEKRSEDRTLFSFAPLPPGVLTPGLKVPNFSDGQAITSALRQAIEATNPRDREITLVIPDAAARVLLLDFDTLPTRMADALPVIRFRLRKMVPFDVDNATLSWQVMSQRTGQVNVLVTVMPTDVLAEYETAVHNAGYEPGAVLPSTLAAAAAFGTEGASLFVNQSRTAVTTAVAQGDEMLLHRTVDLPMEPRLREEEMAQAVISALAWYEDTLRATPGRLYFAGPGGAGAAVSSAWLRLVDSAPPVEELALPARVSMMTTLPPGVAAGVTGALAR